MKRPRIPWPESVSGIAERFCEVAAAVPDAVAVRDTERSLSYRELEDQSARLATDLSSPGTLGDPVVLLMDHDVDLVVAMTAAVRAGRPFTVIDPATPAARMLQVAEDASAGTIVANGPRLALASKLALQAAQIVAIDGPRGPRLASNAPPQETSGIFYTSGSTGEPKGGMRSQAGIVERVRIEDATTPLGPGDVISGIFSCSYGSSQNDTWAALLTGSTLAMYPVATLGVTHLSSWIVDQQVTWLHIPIALLRQFLSMTPAGASFDSLRVVIPSGRQYGADIEAIRAHLSDTARIYSQFGSTETSLAARYVIGPDVHFALDEVVPIGWEVPGARIDLVDESGLPVPDGEEGELWISSPMLSKGYWNRPEQTAAVFGSDPERPGVRRYKTGDFGRRDPQGRVVFVGRRDDRVKVRGYRIELNEVANHLRSLSSIREAHVTPDVDHVDRIIGYVVLSPGTVFEPSEIRRAMSERVPDHLIPSLFVEMTALPLTANGKIDPARLPGVGQQRPPTVTPFIEARTPTEEAVAAIWAETLGIDSVGVFDRFAELGGDSIAAMRVVALVAKQCHAEIPLRRLLERGTVASMSELVDAESSVAVDEIPRAPEGPQPLSHQQRSLWLSEKMGAAGQLNMVKLIDLDGPLDVSALQDALTELSRRHESLRTAYPFDGAEPLQEILDVEPVPTTIRDLSQMPETDAQDALEEAFADQRSILFDLETDRPLRAELCRFGPDRHTLILTTHHIATDRTSSSIALRDLGSLYGVQLGSNDGLAQLPRRYIDYAAWQNDRLRGAEEAAMEYWRERLDPAPTEMTALFASADIGRPRTAHEIPWSLDLETSTALLSLARSENTTGFTVVIACLKAALSRVTGVADPVVAAVMSGRDRAEFVDVVGCFVTLFPVCSATPPAASMRDRVQIEREATMSVLDHRDVPFEGIVAELNPKRRAGRTPFADVTLNYGSTADEQLVFGPIRAARRESGRDPDNSFDVRAWQSQGHLLGRVTINSGLFDPAAAEAVTREFTIAAQKAARNPDG